MKRMIFAIFLLSPLLNAAAQQEYVSKPQNYFVDGGIWYHQLTDSTAEVRMNAFGSMPVQDPLVIPETVQDSAGNVYTVTRIGERAFDNKNISEISLPATLREIGKIAFSDNDSLRSIDFPPGLRRIGLTAFAGCILSGTVVLPDSLESVPVLSFVDNKPLGVTGNPRSMITAYHIEGNPRFCTVDGILYNSDTTELLLAPDVVVDTFYVPSQVRVLGENALDDCGARHIVLNDGLREIYDHVISSRVTTLTIPASVTFIDGKLFSGNVVTLTITVDSASRHYKTVDQMLLSYDGDTLVMGFGVWFGAKALPEGIRVIDSFALSGFTTLDRLDLPYSLEEIGNLAFSGSGCRILSLPGNLRKIGERIGGVFGHVTLPNSLTDIADYALANSYIDTITFGDSIRVIPRGIVNERYSLKLINLGRYVEHIMPEAFAYAGQGVYPIKINSDDYLPETLRTIGRDAFRDANIARVKFHRNPDTVGEYAFNRAQRVWFADTVPPVVFDSSFMAGCDVYLPCHGTAAFTAAPGWGPAFNYMESPCPPTAVDDASPDAPFSVTAAGGLLTVTRTEAVEVGIYDLLGRRLLQAPASTSTLHFRAPASGLYIVKAAGATRKALLTK